MIKLAKDRHFIPLTLGLVFTLLITAFCYFFTSLFSANPWWKQLLAFLLIYLFIVTFFFIAQKWQESSMIRSDKLQNQINQLQLISSLNQLNPHFMFNALNTISSLIVQKDSQVAYRAMIMLTKLMRHLLENSDKISSTLKEELDFIKNYLDIETIRYNKCFEYSITVDQTVDTKLFIPKMVIQLHVENAVKHGLVPKNHGHGILKININQINKTTIVVINDNGIGRDASSQLQHDQSSTGKGIEISEQLIKLYNKLHRSNVSQSFHDLVNKNGQAAGTEVKISIHH